LRRGHGKIERVLNAGGERSVLHATHHSRGVDRGIAAAERGDLIHHEQVVKRIERLFDGDADSTDDRKSSRL
jgi:predicted transcriptional regulator